MEYGDNSIKPSRIWKDIKPRIGEMLVAVNKIETRAEKAQEESFRRGYETAKHECEDCAKGVNVEAVRKEAYDKGYTDATYNCQEGCTFIEEAKKEAYQQGLHDGVEKSREAIKKISDQNVRDFEDMYDSGYSEGLKDAWEAATKIVKAGTEERHKMFGATVLEGVFRENTASEAIECINAYERERKEKRDAPVIDCLNGISTCFNMTLDEIAEVLRKMREGDDSDEIHS